MQILSGDEVRLLVSYNELIGSLQHAFASGEIVVPERHHHSITRQAEEATLLLMPAWQQDFIGIKQVAVFPGNTKRGMATIQGLYFLLDGVNGTPIMGMDAKALTNLRTAATSAMAADLIGGQKFKTMLMVGTGSLAPDLIEAHAQKQPFDRISIWGRDDEKAHQLVVRMQQRFPQLEILHCQELERGVRNSDLISVATLASDPIIFGDWLKPGQHLDLVGAYTSDMREADDEVVRRSEVFVDTMTACRETGDLAIPIATGVLEPTEIRGSLMDLCRGEVTGSGAAPTVFKSVGHASEDLVCAVLAFNKYKGKEN